MNTEGDFEFYRFIWSGADQGWGVYRYPALYGIKITFQNDTPSALELKAIRRNWPRIAKKTVSETKLMVGLQHYTFGQWSQREAETTLKAILSLGVKAAVVEVENYAIVNMKTRVAAQIRCEELYDLVTQTLINNGGEVIPHSGIYPNGAIAVEPK